MSVTTNDGWEILTRRNAEDLYTTYFNEKNGNLYYIINCDGKSKGKYYFLAKFTGGRKGRRNEAGGFDIIICNDCIDPKLPTDKQIQKLDEITGLSTDHRSRSKLANKHTYSQLKEGIIEGIMSVYDNLNAKMKKIIEREVDESDIKSNEKIKSASSDFNLKIYEKDGSATKYSKAMAKLAKKINNINLREKENIENIAEEIYRYLAQYLHESKWNIKGFNPVNENLDSKFMNCSMRKNPSKLNIAAFKAKHLELSDTKRYTQELLGIIAKYTNLIEHINNDRKSLGKAKFERDLKAADDYALKFVSSIVKIKNRKGHRAAITFPAALYEVKDVLIKLSKKCSELIGGLTEQSTAE